MSKVQAANAAPGEDGDKKKKRRSHRDVFHTEMTASLHRVGLLTRANPTGFFADAASADIYIPRCAVEVKTASKGGFSFTTDWRPEQREWATRYCRPSGAEYWLAIFYDKVESEWRVNRDAFLVPYPVLIETHNLVKPHQDTLPYRLDKNHKLALRAGGYQAVTLWRKFGLVWAGGGKWDMPDEHPFKRMYSQPAGLYEIQRGAAAS